MDLNRLEVNKGQIDLQPIKLYDFLKVAIGNFESIAPQKGESLSDSVTSNNFAFTGILIGALPLLGLLGTIAGLLECFAGIANTGASNELVSSGIAKALLTTQLGLLCAIPGWLLQSWVHSKIKHQRIIQPINANPSCLEP